MDALDDLGAVPEHVVKPKRKYKPRAAKREEAVEVAPPVAGSVQDWKLSGKTVRIILQEAFRPEDARGGLVPFGLNNEMYWLRRGVPMDIPVELLEVIEHCTMSETTWLGGNNVVTRDVMRFPYRIVQHDDAHRAAGRA